MKTAAVILFVASCVLCNPLVDEIDAKLVAPQTISLSVSPQKKSGDEGSERYSFLWTSAVDWLNGLGFLSYGTYGYYVTTPAKTKTGVNFNGTDVYPLAYSLAGAGLVAYVGAYLLSFLPSGTGYSQAYGSDIDNYENYDDLGHKLARDQENYDLEGEYDYQYPDSVNGWDFAASETKATRTKRKKTKEDRLGSYDSYDNRDTKRQEGARIRRRKYANRRQPTAFERFADTLSTFFSSPLVAIERTGQAIYDPASFISEFSKRYDTYWQRRRGGHSQRTYRPQYRTAKDGGIELPAEKGADLKLSGKSFGAKWPVAPSQELLVQGGNIYGDKHAAR